MSGIQFTVTLDEAEVDAIIHRATEEVRALAAKSLTAQLIAPMVKERIVPQAEETQAFIVPNQAVSVTPETQSAQQIVPSSKDVEKLCRIFKFLNEGRWSFVPEKTIPDSDGIRVLKSVKYCTVQDIYDRKIVPLFWLPRTPGLCYLDHRTPTINLMLGEQPYAVLKKWNQMGLIKGETETTTTRSMSLRGKARRLVPFKIEILKTLGIDTSWACEPFLVP